MREGQTQGYTHRVNCSLVGYGILVGAKGLEAFDREGIPRALLHTAVGRFRRSVLPGSPAKGEVPPQSQQHNTSPAAAT
jgi:hypothetical protein